ncbi:MAG TPA: hypothetical protein VFV61_08275 [Pyrinomonadaceae bacterium]|nr:hypothetical protein [Pyrinomonadaceae bacterium]
MFTFSPFDVIGQNSCGVLKAAIGLGVACAKRTRKTANWSSNFSDAAHTLGATLEARNRLACVARGQLLLRATAGAPADFGVSANWKYCQILGQKLIARLACLVHNAAQSNNSLDRSGGGVFRIKPGAARVE